MIFFRAVVILRVAGKLSFGGGEEFVLDLFCWLCYAILMPKITDLQIQKNNKTRANVFIDGEFAFALEMITVMKLGLKIGQEVSAERIRDAVVDSERAVAFDKAVNYLSRSGKTVCRMREYLVDRGFGKDTVDYVIDKLIDYRYLDDEAYARMYVEQNSATKGARRLKQELAQRGIERSLAESASEQDEAYALSNASRLAEKYLQGKPRDLKNLQRLQRHLLSRGYDYDVVNSVVRGLGSDE